MTKDDTEAYLKQVERLVSKLYSNHHDLEDLIQEAKLGALKALHSAEAAPDAESYHPNSKRRYVTTAALNRVRGYFRLSANKDNQLFGVLDSVSGTPISYSDTSRRTVATVSMATPEIMAVDALAHAYGATRAETMRMLVSVGFAAVAAVVQERNE